MSSIIEVVEDARVALDTLEAAHQKLAALPLGTLSRSQRQAVLDRLESTDRRLAAVERRLRGHLVAERRFATRRPAAS